MECNNLKSSKVVWITPIITRATDGVELPEIGTGGGAGDLEQLHELDLRNPTMVNKLVELCSREIPDTAARESALRLISEAVDSGAGVVSFQECDFDDDLENMPLKKVTKLLQKIATSTSRKFTAQEHTTSLQVVKSQKSTSHLPVHIVCQLISMYIRISNAPTDLSILTSFLVRRALSIGGHLQANGRVAMYCGRRQLGSQR